MELLVGIALVMVGVLGLAGVLAIVVCFLRGQSVLRDMMIRLMTVAMAGNPVERSAVAAELLRGLKPPKKPVAPPRPPPKPPGARVVERIP